MSIQELQKLVSPKFTEQVLLDIAAKKSGFTEIQVKNVDIDYGSMKKGDAYLSQVCRFVLTATGKNKTGEQEVVRIPVIAKSLPKNVARRKTFRSTDFFENEAIFYEKVWPALEKFQNSKEIKEKFDNIPLLLSSWIDGADDYIALLDVSPEGYASAERCDGLDYEHTVAILRLLASFHAISLAFKDQHPDLFEVVALSLKETYFAEKYRNWYMKFQEKLLLVATDAVEKELPPIYLDKFKNYFSRDVYGELCKWCQKPGPLSVVTHGDVWIPNFLIKYENDKAANIIMIDFQLARYTTLVADIIFFVLISTDINVLEEKWDDIISNYTEALTQNLEKFGLSNLVTLEAVQAEVTESMLACGIGGPLEGLIMTLLGEEDVPDLDSVQGDTAVPLETVWLVHPFKEKVKRQRFASMIKFVMDKYFP